MPQTTRRLTAGLPTMALGMGAAGHRLETKLRAMSEAGFKAVEIFYPCLQAESLFHAGVDAKDKLRSAARAARAVCDELKLEVICLQPLLNYEGIVDEKEHRERFGDAVFRFELCKILGTDLMQVPMNFRLEGITGDEEKVVADLRELADAGLAQSPPIRFALEAMCWSTFHFTWQSSLDLVRKVDRSNVGLVLDAFHIAGYEYADPTLPSGVRPDGPARLAASLDELVKTVPVDKIYYLQLVDAELLSPPLLPLGAPSPAEEDVGTKVSPFHVDGQQPRMSWSRNARLFPEEQGRGGYMPISDVYEAFLKTGFEGFVSLELFTRYIQDSDPSIPTEHAARGWKSWEALHKKLGIDV